jgi:hypothetical protein
MVFYLFVNNKIKVFLSGISPLSDYKQGGRQELNCPPKHLKIACGRENPATGGRILIPF